jgi:hypothetical protein
LDIASSLQLLVNQTISFDYDVINETNSINSLWDITRLEEKSLQIEEEIKVALILSHPETLPFRKWITHLRKIQRGIKN